MRQAIRFFLLPAILVSLGASDGPPRPPAETAVVYVRVDDHGDAVSGLTARNFRVREGGATPWVELAEPAGPASVVFLVENSARLGSTSTT